MVNAVTLGRTSDSGPIRSIVRCNNVKFQISYMGKLSYSEFVNFQIVRESTRFREEVCIEFTSSVQRLIHARYRLEILLLIKRFNDEIGKEDEGNL